MTDAIPDEDWTLTEARAWLRDRVEDGSTCPLCTQFAKVYYRKINHGMVRGLVALYRQRDNGNSGYAHLPTLGLGQLGGQMSRLTYWGLIQEERRERDDGGHAGWWRITEEGIDFLRGRTSVPEYARIYDGRLLGLTGDPCSVTDAIKGHFDLRELMEGP